MINQNSILLLALKVGHLGFYSNKTAYDTDSF